MGDVESGKAAFEAALRGDFRSLSGARASLGAAERLTADALLSLVSQRPPPRPDDCAAVRANAALAFVALRAWLSADREVLQATRAAQAAVDAPPDEAALTDRWIALAEGRAIEDDDLPARLLRQQAASATIEATAQAALGALAAGSIDEAVTLARRATRMARTEGLILMEYLSSLVLARTRRSARGAHFASRIVSALGLVAPSPWQGWIRWERRLAGEAVPLRDEDWEASRILVDLTTAASSRDVEGVRAHAARTFPLAPVQRELATLYAAIDPEAELPNELAPWALGQTDESPGALAGLSVPEIDDDGAERASTFVVMRSAGPPRRALRAGAALRGAYLVDEKYALAHARTLTALSNLLLAGPDGLTHSELFRACYGFDFRTLRDQGALRTLLHRARQFLPEGADIVRDDQRTRLVYAGLLAVPDPRCTLSTEARVLRYIARHESGVSAKETSQALGLSVRTIQNSLRALVEDGACQSIRDGREIGYKVEDTTFNEPTLDRMKPTGIESR